MLSENLQKLRKLNKMTQEQVAARLGVSRQALAKWENGESVPDILNCSGLAGIYHVSLDDLLEFDEKTYGLPVPPRGKHVFGMLEVGENGRVELPKKALDVFHIKPGDRLLLMGDEERGLAIMLERDLQYLVRVANGEEPDVR